MTETSDPALLMRLVALLEEDTSGDTPSGRITTPEGRREREAGPAFFKTCCMACSSI
jgi:hypothetical protein